MNFIIVKQRINIILNVKCSKRNILYRKIRDGKKICKNCKQLKLIEQFSLSNKYYKYYNLICIECTNKKRREIAFKKAYKRIHDLDGEIWKDIEDFKWLYQVR